MHKFVFLTVMKRRTIEFTPSVKFIRQSDELFDVSFCAYLLTVYALILRPLKMPAKLTKRFEYQSTSSKVAIRYPIAAWAHTQPKTAGIYDTVPTCDFLFRSS